LRDGRINHRVNAAWGGARLHVAAFEERLAMDWVPWDATLKTGHVQMDADHNGLAELFNLLADAVEKGKGKDYYGRLLDDIIEHAQTHFDLEERLMVDHHYPKFGQHKAEHTMLIDQALNYRATFDVDAKASPVAVAHFPEVWLAFHILFSDKELADFLTRAV
jgi:hemerythrin